MRAHLVPYCVPWLWPLPAAVQKADLSPWGTNTKKINLWMLPQELEVGRYLGPKESVSGAGTAGEGSDLCLFSLRWDAATGWDAGRRACPLGARTR